MKQLLNKYFIMDNKYYWYCRNISFYKDEPILIGVVFYSDTQNDLYVDSDFRYMLGKHKQDEFINNHISFITKEKYISELHNKMEKEIINNLKGE